MAAASPRGYGSLPWNHERALEVEAELASWLGREFTGKTLWTGAGPSIRELFKLKFPMNVFSTPDLVFVPEYFRDGKIIGWGEPFAFDVTERIEYAWGSRFPTVYAQAEKVDTLARLGNQAYLAYKWKDGVWTFTRAADIAALKLAPVLVDTVIGGVKSKQKNYEVPRGLWCGRDEFRALMLGKIKNSEPIDHVRLLQQMEKARKDDIRMLVQILELAIGRERLRVVSGYLQSMKPMIHWEIGYEPMPSIYIFQDALKAILKGKGRSGFEIIAGMLKDAGALAVWHDKEKITQLLWRERVASVVKALKRHERRWASIQTLSNEIGSSEREIKAVMRKIGVGEFERDARGRPKVFVSPCVVKSLAKFYGIKIGAKR